MHSPRKGHVMITCNAKIILVEFLVHGSKTFSIFLEDELCKITINKQDDGRFSYSFAVETHVDTPLNRSRKKETRKNVYLSLGFIGGFILIICGLIFFSNWFQDRAIDKLFKEEAFQTVASAQFLDYTNGQRMHRFVFMHRRSNFFTPYEKLPDPNILENGFPLNQGDEFEFKFLIRQKKNRFRVFYDKPTGAQITRYILMAARAMEPKEGFTAIDCECLAMDVNQAFGLAGLANLYNHNTSPNTSENYNQETFQKMRLDPQFQTIIQACRK